MCPNDPDATKLLVSNFFVLCFIIPWCSHDMSWLIVYFGSVCVQGFIINVFRLLFENLVQGFLLWGSFDVELPFFHIDAYFQGSWYI